MLIRQEIQNLQDDRYRFTVDRTKINHIVRCYEKEDTSGFFILKGDVIYINKNGRGFKTTQHFKEIESKKLKSKLLNLACKYMDERRLS